MSKSTNSKQVRARAWAAGLLDLLLPRHCVTCGAYSDDFNLCSPCRDELPRQGHACSLCATPLSLPGDIICGACLKSPPPWQSAIAGLDYRFPVDQLVCRFKFGRDLACGQILGSELLSAIQRCVTIPPDAIIPVPLHRRRQFVRTFNQAELLARQVGKRLKIPIRTDLLSRIRSTAAQSDLDAGQRRKNLKGAFLFRHAGLRTIALVDDVITTGATLAECTRAAKRAGITGVSVWVAARANINMGR